MIEQKSKSPLALMEQVIMIVVFAFAAALCVQAFVMSDTMSKEAYTRDKAVMYCQSFAETIKARTKDREEFLLYYNENWEECSEEEADYIAEFIITEQTEYLNKGKVSIKEKNEESEIFSLPVYWQEVADYE